MNFFHPIKPDPANTPPPPHHRCCCAPHTFQIKRIQLCPAVCPACVTPVCCSVDRLGGREGKMSGIAQLSVFRGLCFLWAAVGTARSGTLFPRESLERGPVSLTDMFREVEELMEDTQHILEEAVDQVGVIFYPFI